MTVRVRVIYNDGTDAYFKVNNCNTKHSAYFKVLNYHKDILNYTKDAGKVINTMTFEMPEASDIQIF